MSYLKDVPIAIKYRMDMEASSTYMIPYTTLLLQSQLSIIKQEARYSIATDGAWFFETEPTIQRCQKLRNDWYLFW